MPKAKTPSPASSSTLLSNPITQLDDLWIAGRHRLLCAKSDDTAAMNRLKGDTERPVIVDPPWPIGNTLIASEVLGAHCYALVADAQAIDKAIDRWQRFTGQKAIQSETGIAFGDTAS